MVSFPDLPHEGPDDQFEKQPESLLPPGLAGPEDIALQADAAEARVRAGLADREVICEMGYTAADGVIDASQREVIDGPVERERAYYEFGRIAGQLFDAYPEKVTLLEDPSGQRYGERLDLGKSGDQTTRTSWFLDRPFAGETAPEGSCLGRTTLHRRHADDISGPVTHTAFTLTDDREVVEWEQLPLTLAINKEELAQEVPVDWTGNRRVQQELGVNGQALSAPETNELTRHMRALSEARPGEVIKTPDSLITLDRSHLRDPLDSKKFVPDIVRKPPVTEAQYARALEGLRYVASLNSNQVKSREGLEVLLGNVGQDLTALVEAHGLALPGGRYLEYIEPGMADYVSEGSDGRVIEIRCRPTGVQYYSAKEIVGPDGTRITDEHHPWVALSMPDGTNIALRAVGSGLAREIRPLTDPETTAHDLEIYTSLVRGAVKQVIGNTLPTEKLSFPAADEDKYADVKKFVAVAQARPPADFGKRDRRNTHWWGDKVRANLMISEGISVNQDEMAEVARLFQGYVAQKLDSLREERQISEGSPGISHHVRLMLQSPRTMEALALDLQYVADQGYRISVMTGATSARGEKYVSEADLYLMDKKSCSLVRLRVPHGNGRLQQVPVGIDELRELIAYSERAKPHVTPRD